MWHEPKAQLNPPAGMRQARVGLTGDERLRIRSVELNAPTLINGHSGLLPIDDERRDVRTKQRRYLKAFAAQLDTHGALTAVSEDATHVLGTLRVAESIIKTAGASSCDRELSHAATHALCLDSVNQKGTEVVTTRGL